MTISTRRKCTTHQDIPSMVIMVAVEALLSVQLSLHPSVCMSAENFLAELAKRSRDLKGNNNQAKIISHWRKHMSIALQTCHGEDTKWS